MTRYKIKFFDNERSIIVEDYVIYDNFTKAFDDFREYCGNYMRDSEGFYYPRFYEIKEVEKYEVWGDFR